MKFEGTPGPWFWDSEGLGNKHHIVFGKEYPVDMTNEANKALIVAAPDLLEALQLIQSKMSDFINLANEVGINDADGFYLAAAIDAEQKARAAIAKAIGKEE